MAQFDLLCTYVYTDKQIFSINQDKTVLDYYWILS